MGKPITVSFTPKEIWELDSLLANGVCDYEDPSNKVARSAYDKISRAASRATRARQDNTNGK